MNAGELVDGALRLGDRFGVVFVLCVAVAAAAVAFGFLACRALWRALQAKELEHKAERVADREAFRGALERVGAGVEGLGRQLDRVELRVEDLVARASAPRAA